MAGREGQRAIQQATERRKELGGNIVCFVYTMAWCCGNSHFRTFSILGHISHAHTLCSIGMQKDWVREGDGRIALRRSYLRFSSHFCCCWNFDVMRDLCAITNFRLHSKFLHHSKCVRMCRNFSNVRQAKLLIIMYCQLICMQHRLFETATDSISTAHSKTSLWLFSIKSLDLTALCEWLHENETKQ